VLNNTHHQSITKKEQKASKKVALFLPVRIIMVRDIVELYIKSCQTLYFMKMNTIKLVIMVKA